jgi:hypothetical protein
MPMSGLRYFYTNIKNVTYYIFSALLFPRHVEKLIIKYQLLNVLDLFSHFSAIVKNRVRQLC